MGTEAIWIPLAIAAASGGATYYNTQQTAKKQDRQLGDQIRRQQAKQREADARVAQTISEVSQSNPEAAKQSALNEYATQLQRGQQASALNQGPGAFSGEYRDDTAEAARGIGEYGQQLAGLMARMDAPARQRQAEGVRFADLATDLGVIKRAAGGENYLDQLRLQSIKRNPWIDAAASAGSAYAGNYTGAGG